MASRLLRRSLAAPLPSASSSSPHTQVPLVPLARPCRKLVLSYSESLGSHRGIRDFLASALVVDLARRNPQVEVVVDRVEGNNKHPILRALYSTVPSLFWSSFNIHILTHARARSQRPLERDLRPQPPARLDPPKSQTLARLVRPPHLVVPQTPLGPERQRQRPRSLERLPRGEPRQAAVALYLSLTPLSPLVV